MKCYLFMLFRRTGGRVPVPVDKTHGSQPLCLCDGMCRRSGLSVQLDETYFVFFLSCMHSQCTNTYRHRDTKTLCVGM